MPSGSPKGSIGSNTTGNYNTKTASTPASGAGATRTGVGTSPGKTASPSNPGAKSPTNPGGANGVSAPAKATPAKASPAPKSGLKSEAAISREVASKAKSPAPSSSGKTASNLDRALAVARGAGTLGKQAPGTKAPSDATISSLKREATGTAQPKTSTTKGGILGTGAILNNVPRNPLRDPSKFTPNMRVLPSGIAGIKYVDLPGPLDPEMDKQHQINISRMVEGQRLYGKPVTVNSGYRPQTEAEARAIEAKTGYNINTNLEATGPHGSGVVGPHTMTGQQAPTGALDVHVPKNDVERAIAAFSDAGFSRINPYNKMATTGTLHLDMSKNPAPYDATSRIKNSAAMQAHLDKVLSGDLVASQNMDRPGLAAMSGAPTSVASPEPSRASDPVMDAFREVMGSPDLVSPVRANERQEQNILSRTQLADLSRVVAQPQAPSVAAVDSAAAARRGLKPAAGPIPNPPAPQVAQTPQTPPTLHPDRRIDLAGRRLPAQPLVNTASATAVEGRPPSAIAPGFDQYSPDVQQRIADALEAVFSDESRQHDVVPQQTRDYTKMASRDPSLAGAVAEGADINEAQAVAKGIWGGEPETARASTGDPVLDAIRDIFGGTPPAEAASPVNRQLKEALDPYGDDPDFMAPSAASTMTAERPKAYDERAIPYGDDRTYPTSNEAVKGDRQGIAAAIAALGGVVPEQSPSFAKLAPPHAPYPAPTPQPNPMRQQPDAEVASVGGRYTGTPAPRAPEAPPAPELTGIAPSLKTADVKGILGTMTDILGAPKSNLEVPSLPEAPQTSVITPKQNQIGYTNPPRTYVRELPIPGPLPPVTERGVVPSPNTATPPGIKPGTPVAPPADMFEDGIRPPPAPKPIETPPARFVPGQPAQIATPGAPLDIDPNKQKNPYGTEEDSRPATEEQERSGTKFVTENAPKLNKALTAWSQREEHARNRSRNERVIDLANRIRRRQQGITAPSAPAIPPEPPNASGLTQSQIAAILQAIGAAA